MAEPEGSGEDSKSRELLSNSNTQAAMKESSRECETESTDGYFKSYYDFDVHKLMLQDRPRTLAYRSFFETNRDLIMDKIVMDVGAGTGILSLFAAAAGAKKVYAVEASNMATLCKEIAEENNFGDTIEVIHGAVEDIKLDVKVDIIVSEWMGFYLVHESMLDSVIVARDRFLSPGGIMAPSLARIYVAPVDMSDHFQDRADEWSNIYGFDFSPMASAINVSEVSQPLIQCLSSDVLRSDPKILSTFDLKTVTREEVSCFTSCLKFDITQFTKIHGFACWFDVDFDVDVSDVNTRGDSSQSSAFSSNINEKGDASSNPGTSHSTSSAAAAKGQSLTKSVSLRTGPWDPPTHWKQTVIFLPQTIAVDAGTEVSCRVTMAQDVSTNHRHYNITVALGEDEEEDGSEDDDGDDEDEEDHPVPCQCGSARCQLIAALVEKYGEEHDELGDEAEIVEVQAEVDAANELDQAIEQEGWPMDESSTSVTGHNPDDSGGGDNL